MNTVLISRLVVKWQKGLGVISALEWMLGGYTSKNMKLISKIFASVVLMFVLTGCTISLSCVLLNNTPSFLTIEQFDRTNRADKTSTLAPGKTVRLKSWKYSKFKIISEQGAWSYKPEYVPGEFFHFTGWGPWTKRVFYAQIESNGIIYVLKDKPNGTVNDFPTQPIGFPIKPMIEK